MTTNAIAISRRLANAGVEKQVAEAIAEEIVTHSDEHLATKADIAEIKGEINALKAQIKMQTNLTMGLYIGLALLFVDKLVG